MKTFTNQVGGRVITISLQRGDLLLESIQQAIEKEGIVNGVVVSGIGTLSTMIWHRVTTLEMNPTEEYPRIDGPIELSTIQGLIANGQPHLHMVASDLNGTYSGHLEPGNVVLYLAEIVIMELAGPLLHRELDENGLKQLQ